LELSMARSGAAPGWVKIGLAVAWVTSWVLGVTDPALEFDAGTARRHPGLLL
jgi:hypothetical protein